MHFRTDDSINFGETFVGQRRNIAPRDRLLVLLPSKGIVQNVATIAPNLECEIDSVHTFV